jgi:hypothetical protein
MLIVYLLSGNIQREWVFAGNLYSSPKLKRFFNSSPQSRKICCRDPQMEHPCIKLCRLVYNMKKLTAKVVRKRDKPTEKKKLVDYFVLTGRRDTRKDCGERWQVIPNQFCYYGADRLINFSSMRGRTWPSPMWAQQWRCRSPWDVFWTYQPSKSAANNCEHEIARGSYRQRLSTVMMWHENLWW